ncbi:hypothetical protein [Geminocystis sp. NIES-3709]|uniref:hypothetical protein n=1 Tax=Geminocystis sp. NIES-3709 TaxID=1617448 RepID=UPI0005FC44C8|nr:hypothetical protein [Geminocystis sp. NIES-3709]BAQ65134.1 hypothetical protein GM3709_1899 [Geminocystis sp. NIES-3709]
MYKKLIAVALLGTISLYSHSSSVMAQEQIDQNIKTTGDALQGIDSRSVADNIDRDKTPKLNVTIEREVKPNNSLSTGNEFIDSLMANPSNPKAVTGNELNTNKGDAPSGGGTVPLVNF